MKDGISGLLQYVCSGSSRSFGRFMASSVKYEEDIISKNETISRFYYGVLRRKSVVISRTIYPDIHSADWGTSCSV